MRRMRLTIGLLCKFCNWLPRLVRDDNDRAHSLITTKKKTFLFLLDRICKKTKSHKSPDWSRLVRQKLDEWDGESDIVLIRCR